MERIAHEVAAVGFLSCHLIGPLPYVQHHITVYKSVLSTILNKTFPFFFSNGPGITIKRWEPTYRGEHSLQSTIMYQKWVNKVGFGIWNYNNKVKKRKKKKKKKDERKERNKERKNERKKERNEPQEKKSNLNFLVSAS